MALQTFRVIVEPDREEGGYVAHVKERAGCWSDGDTVQDAIGNVIDALRLILRSEGIESEIVALDSEGASSMSVGPESDFPVELDVRSLAAA